MYTGGSGLDHGFHQFECIQIAAKAGFGVGYDRCKPVDAIFAVKAVNLICALQGVVDSPGQTWRAVGRIQALIGVGETC